MTPLLEGLFAWVASIPTAVAYLLLALAAAVENVFPPVPADTVVLAGGVLAGRGVLNPWTVFLSVWAGNVGGALLVVALGRARGTRFFDTRWGRLLLKPRQLRQLDDFYRRRGGVVIFASRFLPMFRAVVPVFAGVARLPWLRTAIPLAVASAIWYGAIIYTAALAGRNWGEIFAFLQRAGKWLALLAAVAAVFVARWWLRTRHERERDRDG